MVDMRRLNCALYTFWVLNLGEHLGESCQGSDSDGRNNVLSTCTTTAGPRHQPEQDDTPRRMALVLYSPPTYLSAFRQETKTFTFAGRDVTIRQRWEELGVAAVVWDAAVVLAEFLEQSVAERRMVLSGKSVIELGAGTGLVGIVAALLGGNAVLTDRQVALDQLKSNVQANVPENGVRSGISGICVKESDREPNSDAEDGNPENCVEGGTNITVKELSWGENLHEFSSTFDIIVGADIVYVEGTFPKLLETMVHLSTRQSLVLLSCRIRYERDERFLDMMREQFSVTEIFHERTRDIHVYEGRLL